MTFWIAPVRFIFAQIASLSVEVVTLIQSDVNKQLGIEFFAILKRGVKFYWDFRMG